MSKHYLIGRLLVIVCCFSVFGFGQQQRDSSKILVAWVTLAPGLHWCETDAPYLSKIGDSKLTIVKIDPKKVDFELFAATNMDRKPRTALEWSDSFDLQVVFNAGMYDLSKPLTSRGFLKTRSHINQPALHPSFNAMLAFHPTNQSAEPMRIFDLTCTPYASFKSDYESYIQGLRMIDCKGQPVFWKKKAQSCSMLVAAQDNDGSFYLLFSRSPYTHNEFIRMLMKFPTALTTAIYLEGGPETSLFVNLHHMQLHNVGSFVSSTYETDSNCTFWPLPNVVGIRLK
jgi:hypothetical protein